MPGIESQEVDAFCAAWAECQRRWAPTTKTHRPVPRTRSTPPYEGAGLWPVRRCLNAVVNEEWKHRDYAERDLIRVGHS